MYCNQHAFVMILVSCCIGFVPLPGFACDPTVTKKCTCPDDCNQDYCERACSLLGSTPHGWVYRCGSCTCGAYGDRHQSWNWTCFLPGDLFVRDAFAGEPDHVAPAKSREEDLQEFSNPHGDFLLVSPSATEGLAEQAGTIGIQLAVEDRDIVVAGVAKSSPAEKAGISAGDTIVSIDARRMRGTALEVAAKALKGRPGTMVVLRLRKKASQKKVKVVLIRSSDAIREPIAEKPDLFVKTVDLKSLRVDDCPNTLQGCHFLFKKGGQCTYTCK